MSNQPIPPCDDDIFKNGHSVCQLYTEAPGSARLETFVQAVAKQSAQRVDWHFSGGIANVLYIGDECRVVDAIQLLLPGHPTIRFMQWTGRGSTGPYRHGVTPAPANAIASSPEGFLIKS